MIGIQEGENRKKGTEEIFETIMTQNFPQINIRPKTYIQEPQKTPNRNNSHQTTIQHITDKKQKIKDKEKNPKRIQMKKSFHLQRNKNKNYI